jgi:branched-chain amino acid transport system ATP-binding protein
MSQKILKIIDLSKFFGGLAAVYHLSFQIHQGEIVGLIGPNGSGKTTLFNLINGIYTPSGGEIWFQGDKISGFKPHLVAAKGISRTFQLTTLFSNFTVLENAIIGCYGKTKIELGKVILNTRGVQQEAKEHLEKTEHLLNFWGLTTYRETLAKNLPYGHQRRLSIAIAMAGDPDLILLDEPLCGMNPEESLEMVGLIRKIREQGITVLLVEHDMKAVMSICDRIVVINHGVKIAEGTGEEIRHNQDVIEAYLGKGDELD